MISKRTLDIIGASIGLLFVVLLFPFIALAITIDTSGEILYRHPRIGQNGLVFICYKFRTMYMRSESRKHELLARNEMSGPIFKIKGDPRITRVGRFLRKFSLDELPQFLNVLRGEMSLVGPRPTLPDEAEQYEDWHRRRLTVKPGMTGIWQTSGRSRVTHFDHICQMDLQYIDNWSIWLDLRLLLKTLWSVVLGNGAW